jgi:hypothetical protein
MAIRLSASGIFFSIKDSNMIRIHSVSIFLFLLIHNIFAQDTVYLAIGDNFQDSVNAHPPFTTFIVKSGIHRMQDVVSNVGDAFIGEDGAIMSGARVLDNWAARSGYHVHGNQTQEGRRYGECQADYPSCIYPEDLFCNDVQLKRVMSLDEVDSGSWFFDYDKDSVYIKQNPSGHLMEIGVSERAFGGPSMYVTLKNMIIEKYATPSQEGAVIIEFPGDGWLIEDCELRYNHSTGIQVRGKCATIRNNFVHHNGQKGIGFVDGGDSSIIERNELSYNNYLKSFSFGWESGGLKACFARNLTIKSNYSHHNFGPGLWTDINCVNIVYEGNVCEYNTAEGIFHEISDTASIRCNIVRFNGTPWGSNIQIVNSSNTEVFGNVVEISPDHGEGITVVQNDREEFTKAYRWYAKNNYVHNNHIIYKGLCGRTGLFCQWDTVDFLSKNNNRFDYNTYHVPDTGTYNWIAALEELTFRDFQEAGYDKNGTIDTDTSSMDSVAGCMNYAAIKPHKSGPRSYAEESFSANVTYDKSAASIMIDFTNGLSQDVAAAIYNCRGQCVMKIMHSGNFGNKFRIPVSRQPAGTYLLRLKSSTGREITKKIAVVK